MANTQALSKEERKKIKRTARKKASIEKPKKKRDYARGSKKRKDLVVCIADNRRAFNTKEYPGPSSRIVN